MGRIFEPRNYRPNPKVVDKELKAQGYKKWYFTFGANQNHYGECQPIYAKSVVAARKKMFDIYGAKWCWQYSEADWIAMRDRPDRCWPMEKEMDPFVTDEEE